MSAPLVVCKYTLGNPAGNTKDVAIRTASQCHAAYGHSGKAEKPSGALLPGTLSPLVLRVWLPSLELHTKN